MGPPNEVQPRGRKLRKTLQGEECVRCSPMICWAAITYLFAAGSNVIEEGHEAEIHVQLLMAVEQR